MTKKETEKALRNLNKLYELAGSWQAVAGCIGRNRATVNKWFAGTKGISPESADAIEFALEWHRGKCWA